MFFIKSTPHKYLPLDKSNDEIRLVRILPGDHLCCHMEHFPLNSSTTYEALSYAWTDDLLFPPEENDEVNLEIDGKHLPIRRNLHAFLQTAKSTRPDGGWLWIDALCINQVDVDERNAHVLRIGGIYELAEQVIVWLGPQAEESDVAMEFLEFVFNNCPQGRERAWFRRELDSEDIEDQWRALIRLMYRAWWMRVWIVQEVVLAKEIIVMCGGALLTWMELEYAIFQVSKAMALIEAQFEDIPGHERVRDTALSVGRLSAIRKRRETTGALDIVDALDSLGVNQCHDPRDKVYGILGMVENTFLLVPSPDYNNSIEEVYKSLFGAIATNTGKLDFLSLITSRTGASKTTNLPSWCPDLSCANFNRLPRLNTTLILPTESRTQYTASRNQISAATYSREGSSLTVPGIRIDVIDGILATGLDNPSIMRATTQARSESNAYESDEATFEAIWKTFVAGLNLYSNTDEFSAPPHFGELFARLCNVAEDQHRRLCAEGRESTYNISQPLRRPTFVDDEDDDPSALFRTWYKYNREALIAGRSVKSWIKAYNPIPEDVEPQTPITSLPGHQDFEMSWTAANSERRMVTTEEGYIGTVPDVTERGDIICVLLGSRLPVVLRPRGKFFKFIGESYVHGMMEGEALSGLKNGEFRMTDFELY